MFAFDAARLAWPMDWSAVFGRSAPLWLEIGFGNGQFLMALAQQNPEANVIGVEISLPSIKKAERKVQNLRLQNVRLVHGDARVVLWGSLAGERLERLYLNFPDPWHKAAHHHRKLINGRFLHLVATRMEGGGRLDIATDDPGYQAHIAECLEATPYFVSRSGRTFLTEDSERFRTKYEAKALAEGRTPHYFLWARNGVKAENIFPVPQELEMPHAIVKTALSLDEIRRHYQEPMSAEDELPIRFLRLYQAAAEEALLIETHIVEEPMPQRVALSIGGREDGNYIISLHELGFPRPTHGVHRAIASLTRWLVGLDEGSEVVHHNLSGGVAGIKPTLGRDEE